MGWGCYGQANKAYARRFARSLEPTIDDLIDQGYSIQGIANELNRLGVKTRFGKQWRKTQVVRTLNVLGLKTRRRPAKHTAVSRPRLVRRKKR